MSKLYTGSNRNPHTRTLGGLGAHLRTQAILIPPTQNTLKWGLF